MCGCYVLGVEGGFQVGEALRPVFGLGHAGAGDILGFKKNEYLGCCWRVYVFMSRFFYC